MNLLPEIKMLEKEVVKLPTQAGIKTTSLTQTNNPRLFDANCLKCCSGDLAFLNDPVYLNLSVLYGRSQLNVD